MYQLNVNSEHVYCIGDIHGNFKGIISWIGKYDIANSTLIFCGDCGFGFKTIDYYKDLVKKLNEKCKDLNIYCLFLRGNHDDPSYFNSKLFKRGNVRTLRDYSIIRWNDKNILCVGGAISVDRRQRILNSEKWAKTYMLLHPELDYKSALQKCPQNYWHDEAPSFNENELKSIYSNIKQVDYVCTHTSPSFCDINGKQGLEEFIKVDECLDEDLNKERNVMDKLYDYVNVHNQVSLRAWYYAHFHIHKHYMMNGIRFYLLDMDRKGKFDAVEVN